MIFALLLFGLLGAIMGVNIFGGLLRILMFFVMIALLWFIIKAGFYVLLFFAVFYFGVKGINYFVKLFGNLFADTNHKKYRRVPYGDAEIIEILE